MMKINKTDQDASAFFGTLSDVGESQVFNDAWVDKNYALIQGHFPAFGLELTVSDNIDIEERMIAATMAAARAEMERVVVLPADLLKGDTDGIRNSETAKTTPIDITPEMCTLEKQAVTASKEASKKTTTAKPKK